MESDIDKLMRMARERQDMMSKLTGFGPAFELANSISKGLPFDATLSSLSTNWGDIVKGMDFTPPLVKQMQAHHVMMNGVLSSLGLLTSTHRITRDLASSVCNNHITLFGGLHALSALSPPAWSKSFSDIGIALNGLTKNFLSDVSRLGNMPLTKELGPTARLLQTASDVVIKRANANRGLTVEDLDAFKEEIHSLVIQELDEHLAGNPANSRQGSRFVTYLLNFICVIGFIITAYRTYVLENDLSNRELLDQLSNQMNAHFEKVQLDESEENELVCKIWVANDEAVIYELQTVESNDLGRVPSGQQVIVLYEDAEWIYLCYNDETSGKPITGYADKDCFFLD